MGKVDAGDERGIVFDRGGVKWTDAQLMPWDLVPGPDGEPIAYYRKTLGRDLDGTPTFFMQCMPPGFPLKHFQPPYRHYHRTVREAVFVLSGEFPGAEYATHDQDYGDLLLKKEGWFMERQPGSLHGFETGATELDRLRVYRLAERIG